MEFGLLRGRLGACSKGLSALAFCTERGSLAQAALPACVPDLARAQGVGALCCGPELRVSPMTAWCCLPLKVCRLQEQAL